MQAWQLRSIILIYSFVVLISGILLSIGTVNKSDFVATQTSVFKKNFYEDEADPFTADLAKIDSYHQDKTYVRLYLAQKGALSNNMDDIDKLRFEINDQKVAPYAIRQFYGDAYEEGLLCFISIAEMEDKKEHQLKAYVDDKLYVVIPFYKETE